MDCSNMNCKYYQKKVKVPLFMLRDISIGGYCTLGYCKKQFNLKKGINR